MKISPVIIKITATERTIFFDFKIPNRTIVSGVANG